MKQLARKATALPLHSLNPDINKSTGMVANEILTQQAQMYLSKENQAETDAF